MESAPEPKISLRGLSKEFDVDGGTFSALADVTLDVRREEFLCIVGPSGCGKSTLLRMLGGLDTPSRGRMSMRHDNPSRPLTTMIFQQESVFPWLNVEKNAAYGLKVTNTRDGDGARRVEYFLEKTGLLPFRNFYPYQLSGGMKQRLSIARAFVTNPEILLMDEPFAALDEQNKMFMQDELRKLWEQFRSTVVFITHGLEEAVLLGDRVLLMSSAPGRIKQSFDIPFGRPRNLIELRRTPEFNAIVREIWDLLRDEVMRARAAELSRMGTAVPSRKNMIWRGRSG
jgi:NitT/TauT family transport system ATP-binding protein